MNIEVLQYQAWDITNGNYVIWSRPATRQYIESIADLVALEETLKQIDERLVDRDGRAIIDPGSEEARLLRDLSERGGHGSTTGNIDRRPLHKLVDMKLVNHQAVGIDRVDYEITALGQLAVQQLLT